MAAPNASEELAALSRIEDRLLQTSNEDLPKTLDKLLPKLILLTNKAELVNAVVKLFSHLLKRIKNLPNLVLPCLDLLALVSPSRGQFAPNFALTFLDTYFERVRQQTLPPPDGDSMTQQLLTRLGEWKPYTAQSNTLLFWLLQLLPSHQSVANAMASSSIESKSLLGEYLLDIALAQTQIQKADQVASLQPGLSMLKVSRLTVKYSLWTANDLRRYKLSIVEHVLSRGAEIVTAPLATAMAIVLTVDSDWSVTQQALFKSNGARSNLSLDNNPRPTLEYILTLCIGGGGTEEDTRSTLRDDTKCALLRWVVKELPSKLPLVAALVLKLFTTLSSGSSSSQKYRAVALQLADKLYEHMDDAAATLVASALLGGIDDLLTNASGQKGATSAEMDLRIALYSLVERLSRRNSNLVVGSHGINVTAQLFKLLDAEDPVIIPRLYAALGGLRLAFESQSQSAEKGLDDVIRRARGAQEPKNRLAALQWSISLHGYDTLTIETLLILADDTNSVAQEVAVAFRALRNMIDEKLLRNVLTTVVGVKFDSVTRPVAAQELTHTAQVGLEWLLQSRKNYAFGGSTFVTPDRWLELSSSSSSLASADDVVTLLPKVAAKIFGSMIASVAGTSLTVDLTLQSSLRALYCCVLLNNSDEIKNQVQAHCELLLTVSALLIKKNSSDDDEVTADREISGRVAQMLGAAHLAAPSDKLHDILTRLEEEEVRVENIAPSLRCRGAILEASSCDDVHLQSLLLRIRALLSQDGTSVSLQLGALQTLDGLIMRGLISTTTAVSAASEVPSVLFRILTQTTASDDRVRCACLEALSKLGTQQFTSEVTTKVWQWASDMKTWGGDTTIAIRFAIAEALCRMACSSLDLPAATSSRGKEGGSDSVEVADSVYDGLPLMLKSLLSSVESLVASVAGTYSKEKSTCAVILLVLTKTQADSSNITITPKLIVHLTDMLLSLLREADSATQDLSSMSLCHLFHLAQNESTSLAHNVSEAVTSVLLREKRQAAPAGYSVAGEARPTNGNNIDNNRNELEEQQRTRLNVGHIDPLAAAAATAAAELGLGIAPAVTAAGNRAINPAEGGSMGIYTTACKIAKKTGNPSVVFAVMSLIRRDPAFGTGDTAILYERYKAPAARVEKDKLKNLLPTLFLHKHDPHTVIREVMKSLWHTLITPEHQPLFTSIAMQVEILSSLKRHLSSSLWREREAACLALEMFLPQKSFDLLHPALPELWLMGMNVLDDVRDTTRAASIGFLKVLSDLVIRACNPDESPSSIVDACISTILPILLEKGLVAPTPEGRGFSLGILVRIVKTSKSSLKDWLVRLVAVLVEAMSALEPKTLQYMSFHTTRLNISADELDGLRLKLMENSPMQESLDGCLQSLSTHQVQEVTFHLIAQLNRGVGLATRVAACKSLCYIAEFFPSELGTVHGNRAFDGIVLALTQAPDMAISLRKTLMSGLGSLGKVVLPSSLEAVLGDLITRYNTIGRDQTSTSIVIAGCIQQLVNRCGERVVDDALWSRTLCCVHVGTFDADAESKQFWVDTWSETVSLSGTGTKTAALIRILPLLAKVTTDFICDLKWSRRVQGIHVLSDLLRHLPAEQISPHIAGSVEALLLSIPGQIWAGQGQALECLGQLLAKLGPHGNMYLQAPEEVVLMTQSASSEAPGEFEFETVLTLRELLVRQKRAEEDNAEDLMDIAEFHQDYHVKSAAGPKSRWAISARGVIFLLINEARRGDKEYKLSAVHALSLLPWRYMSATAPESLLQHLPLFLSSIGVPPYAKETTKSDGAPAPAPATGAAAPTSRTLLKPTTYKRPTSSLSLFGVRYGAGPATAPASATSASASSADKRIRPKPAAAAVTTISGGAALESPVAAPNAAADSDSSNNSMDVVQEPTTDAPPQSEPTSPTRNDVDETSTDNDVQQLRSSDPAFRVKLLEAVTAGMSAIDVEGTQAGSIAIGSESSMLIREAVAHILAWVPHLFRSAEVWSIRQGSLKLVEALLQLVTPEADGEATVVSHILDCIECGVADSKTKIKVVALQCLKKLVGKTWFRPLSSPAFHERVAAVQKAAHGFSATAPEILSELTHISAALAPLS